MRALLLSVSLASLLFACAPKPYQKAQKIHEEKVKEVITKIDEHQAPELYDSLGNAIKTAYIPTVNFGSRRPDFVIIHHTAQDSLAQTIKTFTLEHTQASAHYIVSRDGEVVQMLSDDLRAWHAGLSKWGNNTDMNSCSIGIELDNNGKEPFSEAQINSLLILLAKLKTTYNIPVANFIGHADVAPKRKADPSILFPWKKLADAGFGLWYDMPNALPPANFDVEGALRRIGYDTSNLPAAIIAFKRHFVQIELSAVMTSWDKCVLYNLYKKY
ncbi:N-acetylmuramoyl-L-alanine amidase [Pelobium manganitolerans]|uniref:N-acetylmuramoyl-L-alanine amidase n=1 Tax=Pelobium manganitolerans TaxID=1842495 RepID=UPI003FA3B37C